MAMRWQHTRCRIGRTRLHGRNKGVTDIGHANDDVWGVWQTLTELLRENQVGSLCVFGTFHNGETFNALARGNANINVLIGAASLMLYRTNTHYEP